MTKRKYYVVWEGHEPGIYDSWSACQLQIKGYPNARYKAFESRQEAETALRGRYTDFPTKKAAKKPTGSKESTSGIIWDSISVDAACSGNPGALEYQGVHTQDRTQIFHQQFPLGTNNIGEFLAIVHALALLHRQGSTTPIYSDSKIAIGWVRKKKCATKLPRNAKTAYLYELIDRAEKWLKLIPIPTKS